MTSTDDVMATAVMVVAELPVPFTKEDFLASYRLSGGKMFPSLKSLNLDLSTFKKFFNYLPDVYETDIDGEFFYCNPKGPKSLADIRRDLRELQTKRRQQFIDRCVFIAKGLTQPFRIADLDNAFKMKYPEHSSGLPAKKFGFQSTAGLMKHLSDRIRSAIVDPFTFEYYGKDDVEEPPSVPRTLEHVAANRTAVAATVVAPTTATPAAATPAPPRGALPAEGTTRSRDDVIETPANTMGQSVGRREQTSQCRRLSQNQPSSSQAVRAILRRPAAAGGVEKIPPRPLIPVKQELPDIEILAVITPTRSMGRNEATATGQNAPHAFHCGQPAMNETFTLETPTMGFAGANHFFQAMIPQTPAPQSDKPSGKNEAFGTFIACRLDEAEREGRDVGEIIAKIHAVLNRG